MKEWRGFLFPGHIRAAVFPGRSAVIRYFKKRDVRRSARIFPFVWHVGQYCRAVSAKETSRTVSPVRLR